jgi:hypothetical protein
LELCNRSKEKITFYFFTDPYSLSEAKDHLMPLFSQAAKYIEQAPKDAFPEDYAVLKVVLNPSYIAKSYYPGGFFGDANLTAVGSQTVRIEPRKWNKKTNIKPCDTASIFVAGKRADISNIPFFVDGLLPGSTAAKEFSRLETVKNIHPEDRLSVACDSSESFFEVALHLLPNSPGILFPFQNFCNYANTLNFKVYQDLRFMTGNLLFVPIEGDAKNLLALSYFSFIRVISAVPRLRDLLPFQRSSSIATPCLMPIAGPVSPLPRVAILDGGLPKGSHIRPWVRSYQVMDESATDHPGGPEHGLAVSSAFLFGPIEPNGHAARPFAYITNIRVLDGKASKEDPLELYRTLGHIQAVLLSNQYDFLNLSVGPDIPIEDNQVHAWTAVIDDLLSTRECLMTIAAGNNGKYDRDSGNARIQTPADCVNGVSVGAAGSELDTWEKASYSAWGPGRRPGFVKPDVLAFGGDAPEYFHVLASGKRPEVVPQQGTSLAAPNLLRTAVAIRSIMGPDISTLSIKALLIHAAQPGRHDKHGVGWGKVPEFYDVITCLPGVARVVYQGQLTLGKYLRARLPVPDGGLHGKIKLKATFCFTTPVVPQDPIAYTKSALEVVFRPKATMRKPGKSQADSKPFFSQGTAALHEDERRSNLNKWENVLHAEKIIYGSSLKDPMFDIHYMAREGGKPAQNASPMSYSLILTIEAPKNLSIFNDILSKYRELVALQPIVQLPERIYSTPKTNIFLK